MPRTVALVALLALTLALTLALVAAAAPAHAQSDASERQVQARAYAAAALDLRTAARAAAPVFRRQLQALDTDLSCFERVARDFHIEQGDVPEEAIDLLLVTAIGGLARTVNKLMDPFLAALAEAPSADRILDDGREGWESVGRFYRPLATIRGSGCTLLRAWAKADFKRSARPKIIDQLERALASVESDEQLSRDISRAGVRMVQLGARSRGARAFAGVLGGPFEEGNIEPFFGAVEPF